MDVIDIRKVLLRKERKILLVCQDRTKVNIYRKSFGIHLFYQCKRLCGTIDKIRSIDRRICLQRKAGMMFRCVLPQLTKEPNRRLMTVRPLRHTVFWRSEHQIRTACSLREIDRLLCIGKKCLTLCLTAKQLLCSLIPDRLHGGDRKPVLLF